MKTKQVKIWLMQEDIKAARIARELGITRSWVSQVLSNIKPGHRVRQWLLDHGCPPELLEEDGEAQDLLDGEAAA